MKTLLVKLLLSLLERLGYQHQTKAVMTHPSIPGDLLIMAERLVAEQIGKGPSGEYRRHQVLAKLIKAGWKERDAALAIELAVRNVSP